MAHPGTHPDDAVWHRLLTLTGGAADTCYQCEVCSAVCRWRLFDDDGPEVPRLIRDFEAATAGNGGPEEPVWRCTTCGSCDEACPQGVSVSDVLLGLRTLAAERGRVPRARDQVLRNVWLSGNPDAVGPGDREELDAASPLPPFEPEGHCLLYLGSPVAYDPRQRRIATAMRSILNRSRVEFGVLDHEPESGDVPRLLGERDYFDEVLAANVFEFERLGVREIVTLSPHDYDVFRRFYPQVGARLRVFHATQYLAHLVRYDLLAFAAEREARVLYHDPCYLGRRHGIYEAPRRVLRAMPGLELQEFEECREDAVCCGGGGGRIWLEPEAGESFALKRVTEAGERGADYLATACPYCIQMFEDVLERRGFVSPKVCHVAELAASWGPYKPLDPYALEGATA